MYAASEMSTVEKEHLENELWRNRYEDVAAFLQRRSPIEGSAPTAPLRYPPISLARPRSKLTPPRPLAWITSSTRSPPLLQHKVAAERSPGNTTKDGYGAEWLNQDEHFYGTGSAAMAIKLRLKNVGSKSWPPTATLNNQGGELLDVGWRMQRLPPLRPGNETEVTVRGRVPSRSGKIFHYFQVDLSAPDDEVRVVGEIMCVTIICSALGKTEKRREGKEQQKPQVASLSLRDRALSLEGQKMWRRATPTLPF